MSTINIRNLKKQIQDVSASNRNALYDSHIYWSQKPYNICNILIENLSTQGDIVFDPFLGSGVTLLEAIKKENNRIGVGAEINEAPLFIVKTLLRQYDLNDFKKAQNAFLKEIKALLPYYYTTCPNCKKRAVITSVIFDKESRDSDIKIKVINYRCICTNKGSKEATENDYTAINILEPLSNINDEILLHNTKIAVYKNQRISQIFTGRNFTLLDKIVGIINGLGTQKDVFKYILMSVLHLCKITDKHSNSQWPLWIPKTDCVEKNIIDILDRKVAKFQNTIKYLQENYNSDIKYSLLHKGSQYIDDTDLKDNSVQLIITDPPYLGQVAYSEYMQLYKPFLSLDFNLEDEIIVSSSPERKITEDDYFRELEKVFKICSRKIKDDGYLCMYFHDCNLNVWDKLVSIMSRNKFTFLSQIHIKKSNTLKNIISPKKSLNGDAILLFAKDGFCFDNMVSSESVDEIEINIVAHTKHVLRQYGPMSTPELYDGGLMEMLIQNGWLTTLSNKYKTLVDIFEKYLLWDSTLCKWKIAGE